MYLGRTILISVGHSCRRLDSTNPQRPMSLAPCIKHLVSRPIHKVHLKILHKLVSKLLFNGAAFPDMHELPFIV